MTEKWQCTEANFLKDVANHQMTVVRDDGVYRHVIFQKPGSSDQRFDLITWPECLCYTGDMGTYVFRRTHDMFAFFRKSGHGEALQVNTGYWAEKLEATDKYSGHSEYSHDKFREEIKELLDNSDASPELREAIEDDILSCEENEYAARAAVHDFDDKSHIFGDFWETNLHVRPLRFIWCCYALAWGIQKYDQAKDAALRSDPNNPAFTRGTDAVTAARAAMQGVKIQPDINNEMLDALKWFVVRVEKGEVRSQRTYARFKEIIAKSEGK